jgi:bisphosphoglycerate-independent phosphoglycerate mutase (AlkP superfamily)
MYSPEISFSEKKVFENPIITEPEKVHKRVKDTTEGLLDAGGIHVHIAHVLRCTQFKSTLLAIKC